MPLRRPDFPARWDAVQRFVSSVDVAGLPVPAGNEAVVEVNLLSSALVGCFGGNLNRTLAFNAAATAAGVPERGATIRTVYLWHGACVRESVQQSRPDGTGRCGAAVEVTDPDSVFEIHVELSDRSASDRLRSLIAAIENDVTAADLQPARNALELSQRLEVLPIDRDLAGVYSLIASFLSAAQAHGQDVLLSAGQAIIDYKNEKRYQLSVDARSAAAMLLAADIPQACANSYANRIDAMNAYQRYLTIAGLRLRSGNWQMMDELVGRAVADGHLAALDEVADKYLTQAKAHRDHALDAPADPLEFARRLYEIGPHALAATWISHWVRASTSDPVPDSLAWARRETEAEELAIRAGDGLDAQYIGWLCGSFRTEQQQVQAAHAAGDRRQVYKLLRKGELALVRPRSYRPFLEGTAAELAVVLAAKQ